MLEIDECCRGIKYGKVVRLARGDISFSIMWTGNNTEGSERASPVDI